MDTINYFNFPINKKTTRHFIFLRKLTVYYPLNNINQFHGCSTSKAKVDKQLIFSMLNLSHLLLGSWKKKVFFQFYSPFSAPFLFVYIFISSIFIRVIDFSLKLNCWKQSFIKKGLHMLYKLRELKKLLESINCWWRLYFVTTTKMAKYTGIREVIIFLYAFFQVLHRQFKSILSICCFAAGKKYKYIFARRLNRIFSSTKVCRWNIEIFFISSDFEQSKYLLNKHYENLLFRTTSVHSKRDFMCLHL